MHELRHFVSGSGDDVVQEWLDGLRDIVARIAVLLRLDRMAAGNFGDHSYCRQGVWELRVDVGPGFRVYYALWGDAQVLLLCGGEKRTQDADVARAVRWWQEVQQE